MRVITVIFLSAMLIGIFQLHFPSEIEASATLQVRAQVLPWLILSAEQHILSYEVQKTDLQRGYVDLHDAMTVHMQTNILREIAINLFPENNERLLVKENGAGNFVEGVLTLFPSQIRVGEMITRQIDYRIILTTSTSEGTHLLRVALSPAF